MVQLESDNEWLRFGRQKSAVAQALQRPMTEKEIWRAAQQLNTRIQLRDVWFILRQLEKRGFVQCFNPRDPTCKIFFWTDRGRQTLREAFGIALQSPAHGINWKSYAFVMRGRLRRAILLELGHVRNGDGQLKTASGIRRNLNENHPVGLNAVIDALKALCARKLIEAAGEGDKRGQKFYRLTKSGKRIAEALLAPLRTDCPQTLLKSPSSESHEKAQNRDLAKVGQGNPLSASRDQPES